jgi:hypothetical protein
LCPKIPAERSAGNLVAICERFGTAVALEKLEETSPNSGAITVRFERGQLSLRLRVADQAPHAVGDFGPAR